ncbi:TPA: hypothetical protein EYN65_08810 [Candidatus Poribacteria bacterium]|nr:hypothetical protein [Candidatus Poribacteria bacterium]
MALFYKDLRGYHFTPENFEKALPTIKNLSKQTDSRHDWKLTIQLLRGVDDGIIEGSSKHSAGMLEFYRTSPEFRRRFVTMQSLGFRDIPALLALDKKDLVFFLNRFARGFHSKVRPTRVRGPLGDLSKLSWRMGARVKLTLASKEVIEAETILPPA